MLRGHACMRSTVAAPCVPSHAHVARSPPCLPASPSYSTPAPDAPAAARSPPLQRHNPQSDLFPMHKFHHVELWCGDATTTSCRYCSRGQRAVDLGQGEGAHAAQAFDVRMQLCSIRLALALACLPHRFGYGLGLGLVAKSDQSTGNHHYASYVMQSGERSRAASLVAPHLATHASAARVAVCCAHRMCALSGDAVGCSCATC